MRDHAVLRSGKDVVRDAEGFVVADERGDRGRVDHDLVRGDAALAIAAGEQGEAVATQRPSQRGCQWQHHSKSDDLWLARDMAGDGTGNHG